jgi:hypothetical protein
MVQILYAIYAVLSTLSFLALAGYIFLIWRGQHARLHSMPGLSGFTHKAVRTFLFLAAIGFLVCIYKGTEAMLSWMPAHLNSDEEWTSAASVIALIFTMLGGGILIEYILHAHENILSLELIREKALGLEAILERSDSPRRLDDLKKEFEGKIKALRTSRQHIIGISAAAQLPETQRAESFRYLVWLIDNQKSKLAHGQQ